MTDMTTNPFEAAHRRIGCEDPACPCHAAPVGQRNTTHHAATKDTNPKDAIGTRKVPASCVPAPVIAEIGLALLEGACKYGRHNYRIAELGVRASVYYDATMRHLWAWWEGEDIDPDSGLSHVTKAIASLTVLRDAMIRGNVTDDRPPRTESGWVGELNEQASAVLDRFPDKVPAYTAAGRDVEAPPEGTVCVDGWTWQGETPPPVDLPEGMRWDRSDGDEDWDTCWICDDHCTGFVRHEGSRFEVRLRPRSGSVGFTSGGFFNSPLAACRALASHLEEQS
jgi:hypothetical protein